MYGRLWNKNLDDEYKFGVISILGPRFTHSNVVWFDFPSRTIYHYDSFSVRAAHGVAKVLMKLFSGWTIIGTEHKHLVQREEIVENGKIRYRCKDYFCTWWCLLYLMNRTKGLSHEQSCKNAKYSELLGLIIQMCINYRKLLEDVKI